MDNQWIKEMEKYYKAGVNNVFYIHGNTKDYANLDQSFYDYVCMTLVSHGLVKSFNKGGRPNPAESDVAYVISVNDVTAASSYCNPNLVHSDVNILIVLIGEKLDTSEEINSNVYTIEIPYPNEVDRVEFIYQLINRETQRLSLISSGAIRQRIKHVLDQFTVNAADLNVGTFGRLTAGLTKKQIEDAWLLCLSDGVFDYNLILERKQEVIRREFGDVIEIFDSNNLMLDDYSGQAHIKKYLREVVIEPIINGNSGIVPKGLLFCGPPGTGKTYLANCLAGEGKVNFIELKMNRIYDMYVGNSEKNFQKAMTCIRSLYPVMVFIDEIDQVFKRSNGGTNDGGSRVAGNIFGMFLSQLSDPKSRGKIVWIAATNYPNNLDEALKRTGRFDKKIPFLPPNEADRAETFRLVIKKNKAVCNCSDSDFKNLAEKTKGYVQSDIEQVVVKALELLFRRKEKQLTLPLLEEAAHLIVIKENEKIKEMTALAVNECNDRELLPVEYQDQ